MNEVIIIIACMIALLVSIALIYIKQNKSRQDALPLDNAALFKSQKADGITSLLCGIVLIGLFVFISFKDSEATLWDLLVSFLIGTIICLIGIGFLTYNFKAYLYISNGRVNGKYHWFGKIDCSISDIDFALAQINTLIIQLKDGKTHTIMGVENSWQLASFIRRNISFDITEEPEALIKKLNDLKSAKRSGFIHVFSCSALMFVNIFVTVFLTGEREMHEFTQIDWTVFAVMSVIEILTVTTLFYFAKKVGKNNLPIEKLQYTIQRRIIETQPLLPGNAFKAFTDENYTGRITVYGYPNEASVYYKVEKLDRDYTLYEVFESEVFENFEQLAEDLDALTDITEKVLC